jgi:hypothetical protein
MTRLPGHGFQTSPPRHEAELPEEEEANEAGHNDETGDRYENDLVLLSFQRKLLPLLMKEEFLYKDFMSPDVDSSAVGAALHSIVTELRQYRDNALSSILATVQAPTSPAMKESPSVVPSLKAYGVSLEGLPMLPNQREGLLGSKPPKKELARSKAWSIMSEPINLKVNLGVDRGRVSYHDEDERQFFLFGLPFFLGYL